MRVPVLPSLVKLGRTVTVPETAGWQALGPTQTSRPLFSTTTMSCGCCGEPRTAEGNGPQQGAQRGFQQQPAFNQWSGPITQQPGLHPPPAFGHQPHVPGGYPQGSLPGPPPPQPPPPAWMPNSATPVPSQWNTSSTNSYTPLLDHTIVRPSPVHAQGFRTSTVSPPPDRPATGFGQAGAPPGISQQTMDEGKMSVSIDFGKWSASHPALKRS
jgi:hypothetical protein